MAKVYQIPNILMLFDLFYLHNGDA